MDTGVCTSWNSYLAEWHMVVAQVAHQGGVVSVCVCVCLSIYLCLWLCLCARDTLHLVSLTLAKGSDSDADGARRMCCLLLYSHCVCACSASFRWKLQVFVSVWVCARAWRCVTKGCVAGVLSGGKCCVLTLPLRGGRAAVDIGLLRSWVFIWTQLSYHTPKLWYHKQTVPLTYEV